MMPGVLVVCAGIVLRMSNMRSRRRCMLMGVMPLMLLMMMMVLVLVVHG